MDEIIGRNAEPGAEFLQQVPLESQILDLGCGQGGTAESLSAQGYRVTAIDVNRDAILQGRQRKSGVTYLVGDVLQGLPCGDASFDAIVLSFVLVNIIPFSERRKALQEMTRLLKPAGVAWVNEGTISEEYGRRYTLCRPYTGEDHSFFVYRERGLSKEIQTSEQLAQAIADHKVARIAHHFSDDELRDLFAGFKEVFHAASVTASPNSHLKINMSTFLFQKR